MRIFQVDAYFPRCFLWAQFQVAFLLYIEKAQVVQELKEMVLWLRNKLKDIYGQSWQQRKTYWNCQSKVDL